MTEVSIADFAELIREADRIFEVVGGSTRHYVADCLLPLMKEKGMRLISEPDVQVSDTTKAPSEPQTPEPKQ